MSMFAPALLKFLFAAACLTASSLFFYRPSVILHQADDDFALSLQSAPEAGLRGGIRVPITDGETVAESIHWTGSNFFPTKSQASLPAGRPSQLPAIQHQPDDEWREQEETEALDDGKELLGTRDRVKAVFLRSWNSYKERAWRHDEILPVSGEASDPLNGWATVLIDSLDTLWIMDLKDDFELGVTAVAQLDFTTSHRRDIAVRQIATRCLGGLIGAFEVSNGAYPVLLDKAKELGDVLLGAFDTPNRMPINYYDWTPESTAKPHRASSGTKLHELGSSMLEFTKLAQLTGDAKYFDAVDRVLAALKALQGHTKVPGLWPSLIDASGCKRALRSANSCSSNGLAPSPQSEEVFTLGDGVVSVYSSLLKQSLLVGGQDARVQAMHTQALKAIDEKLLFRPLIGGAPDVLMIGDRILDHNASWYRFDKTILEPRMSRSSCAAASIFALGARTSGRPEELDIARRLTDGCIWAHDTSRSKLMPAEFTVMTCANREECKWEVDEFHQWWEALDLRLYDDFDLDEYEEYETPGNRSIAVHGTAISDNEAEDEGASTFDETEGSRRHNPLQSQTVTRPTPFLGHEDFVRLRIWNEGLAEGMLDIHDRTYDLGPEVIESIFTMYRITGDARWREAGLRIFDSIELMTATALGNAELLDTTKDEHEKSLEDTMPGAWMGRTLKYYWLLFADEDVLSLDDWVFSSAGHPFRLPK